MKTLLVLGAVIAMTGCDATSPEQLAECETIADDSVVVVNDIVEENGDLSTEEFVAKAVEPKSAGPVDPDAGGPVAISDELEGRLAELADRIESAGCSDGEFARLYRERADRVDGDGFLADMFRKGFERGESPTNLSR